MDEIDAVGPSRQVLAEAPGRALKFLGAAGKSLAIRAALRRHGYTEADHKEGWDLLHAASGFGLDEPSELEDAQVGNAITELDAWDEPYFRIIRAALERRHPVQARFVFNNLEPGVGPVAVISVRTLLDRLEALEKSPERKSSRKEDHAALKTLESRGITREERKRLRELVRVASGEAGGAGANDAEGAEGAEASEVALVDSEEHQQALRALYAWYKEWSETARAVIKRRDHLIRLGLAHRKKPAKKVEATEG